MRPGSFSSSLINISDPRCGDNFQLCHSEQVPGLLKVKLPTQLQHLHKHKCNCLPSKTSPGKYQVFQSKVKPQVEMSSGFTQKIWTQQRPIYIFNKRLTKQPVDYLKWSSYFYATSVRMSSETYQVYYKIIKKICNKAAPSSWATKTVKHKWWNNSC